MFTLVHYLYCRNCKTINCNQGDCLMDVSTKRPKCVCKAFFAGEFCDHYICSGYCANSGICFHNDVQMANRSDGSVKPEPRCMCPPGYTGKRCEISEDNCDCQNGGKCRNNDCECQQGWTGTKCEMECPCLNNGTCEFNPFTGVSCQCPRGYSGLNCQYSRNPAVECFCNDIGGRCETDLETGEIECKCYPGFKGEHCDECDESSAYCFNDGICRDQPEFDLNVKYPRCVCPTGFDGPRCEHFICSKYCLHGGTPSIKPEGGCSCACKPNAAGRRCERVLCKKKTCENGGRCILLDGKEICECPKSRNFAGERCELSIHDNPCRNSSLNCMNGGICRVDVGTKGPECLCPVHYAGSRCQMQNLCLDLNCRNGGKCVWTAESRVKCQCGQGFEGESCEYKMPTAHNSEKTGKSSGTPVWVS